MERESEVVVALAEGLAVDLVECLQAMGPVVADRAAAPVVVGAVTLRAVRSSRKSRRCG